MFGANLISLRWQIFSFAVVIAALVLFLLGLQPTQDFTGDNAYYLGLADSLRNAQGYVFNGRSHTRFPPGFPLLLAAVREYVSTHWIVMLQAMAIGGALSVLLVWVLFRSLGSAREAAIIVAFFASTPYFFHLVTTDVRSEIPYIIFSSAALWSALHLRGPLMLRATVIGSFAGAAVLTRSAGVSLVAALCAAALLTPKLEIHRRAALLAGSVVAGAAFLLWTWWVFHHRQPAWEGEYMDTYLSQISLLDPHRPYLGSAGVWQLVVRALENVVTHVTHFSEVVFRAHWLEPAWYSPFFLVPALVLILGSMKLLRSPLALLVYYATAYLILFLLWPWDESMRFILPVCPVLFFIVSRGLREGISLYVRHPLRVTKALLVVATIGALATGAQVVFAESVGRQTIAMHAFWIVSILVFGMVLLQTNVPALTARVERSWRPAVEMVLALLMLGGLWQELDLLKRNQSQREEDLRHFPTVVAARWLAQQSAPGSIVMAQEDAIVHFVSHRRTVSFPVTDDPQLIAKVISDLAVDYLIVVPHQPLAYFLPTEGQRLEGLRTTLPERLSLVFANAGAEIYAIDKKSEL